MRKRRNGLGRSVTAHLDAVPTEGSISLAADEDGYLGRECPREECGRYFKITPGTGLAEVETRRCPYCGHEEHDSYFHTQAQVDYAVSILNRNVLVHC